MNQKTVGRRLRKALNNRRLIEAGVKEGFQIVVESKGHKKVDEATNAAVIEHIIDNLNVRISPIRDDCLKINVVL